MNIFQQFLCAHDDEILNDFIIPSEFETILQNGKTPTTHSGLKRKYVTDFKCKKCGRVKRITETTA